MTSRAWDDGLDDGLEDWERDLTRPDGFPLVATLAGSGAIILVAILAFNFLTIDVVGHVAAVLGVALLVAIVVFAGAWVLTLRHATLGWNVIAGGAFAGVALMTVVVALAIDAAGTQADARTVRLIRINGQGEPALPPGVKGGPITAATMDFWRHAFASRRQREAMAHALGLDRLADANAVAHEPALLRDCGRFARAAPQIDDIDRLFLIQAQAYRTRLAAISMDSVQRQALLRGVDDGLGSSKEKLREGEDRVHRLLDQAGPLCRLLSARHWKAVGSMFMFTTQADLNAFRSQIERWNALVHENENAETQRQQHLRDWGIVDGNSRL